MERNKFKYDLTRPMVEHLRTWYNSKVKIDTMCLLHDLRRMGLKVSEQTNSLRWLHNRMHELGIRKKTKYDYYSN